MRDATRSEPWWRREKKRPRGSGQRTDTPRSIHGLVTGVSSELAHDRAQVTFDGLGANSHLRGGFNVGVPQCDASQNVELTGGKLGGLLDANRGNHLIAQHFEVAAQAFIVDAVGQHPQLRVLSLIHI